MRFLFSFTVSLKREASVLLILYNCGFKMMINGKVELRREKYEK